MPASKRKPRRKAADMNNDTSEVDMPHSSPLRQSSTKKRKVSTSPAATVLSGDTDSKMQINGSRAATRRKSLSPDPAPSQRFDDSGDESETVSQSDLIDSVVSYLQVAKEPVVATAEYANEKEQQENVQKVSAYAKIAGRDWTYFVREQSVNIGRPPDGAKDNSTVNAAASSPIVDMKEVLPVHIDLGPSKIVSRHHASIFYDGEFPEGGGWHVRVNGRNGVRVNNALLKRGNRMQISSGTILEIAGTQMMFVTPGDKAQIEQSFIDRAKALATGEEFLNISHSHPEHDLEQNGGYQNTGYIQGNFQSLAPAPPNFQRARTPPQNSDGRDQRGVFDSKPAQPGMYNRGLMMESTQEIDYSRDNAKDLKPPYSYATMIAQAIFSSEEEKLTLSNIYAYIVEKFAFYRHSNSGWQVS
jgi:forkhead protein FKH